MLREYFEHACKVSAGQHTPHDLKLALSWHHGAVGSFANLLAFSDCIMGWKEK